MTAVEIYPEGIGKHIVCIYGGFNAAALQTVVRVNPKPQIIRHRGINSGSSAAAEREDN